jgi:hypothetical protein
VVLNRQVYYTQFSIDQQTHRIDKVVAPVPATGEPDRLAIAIQLDGNFRTDPYSVFIDQVSFVRTPIKASYLPLTTK